MCAKATTGSAITSKRHPAFSEGFYSLPDKLQGLATRKFEAWREQGFPLPCGSPRISFRKRIDELPVFGCDVTDFYRAYMVLRGDVAIWYFIGNHPDRGHIPPPPA